MIVIPVLLLIIGMLYLLYKADRWKESYWVPMTEEEVAQAEKRQSRIFIAVSVALLAPFVLFFVLLGFGWLPVW